MASPRTNLDAPSMAPKNELSSSSALRRARASLFVDEAGGEIGVDRHLLAGHGVQGEARRDFGDARRTAGDDDEVHDHQDREHDHADDELAAHHELRERRDHFARGVLAGLAVGEDEARRGDVEREPQQRRQQQHGRETP